MQRVQVPQCASSRRVGARSSPREISPRKKSEPASRDSSSVCLPRQPRPARAASATSITGALSVKTR
jgi:hypothetical protein